MKTSLRLLFAFFLITHLQVFAQTASPRAYVNEALDIMKSRSVNKSKVDWEKVYASALAKTDTATSIRNTYPIIAAALKQLKDHHSGFYPPEMIEAYKKGYRALGMEFPAPEFKMLDNKYAYIQIPPFGVINLDEQREYAASIQAAIKQLDKQKPKGWIIDLRENGGGMSKPMTAGLGPFVENEKSAGWRDADGQDTYWIYRNGQVYQNDELVFDLNSQPYKLKSGKKPVSVLVSKKTASSGEVLATSFVGRKNTKLIGTHTQGLTSSNSEHELSDGAYLVLTEGNYINRYSKEYDTPGVGIAPDIVLENLSEDAAANEALYLNRAKEYIDKRK